MAVTVTVGPAERSGRAVDLASVDDDAVIEPSRDRLVATLTAAIREGDATDCGGTSVSVSAPAPGPGHAALARVPGDESVRARLAAVARSRGLTAGVDGELAARREELASLPAPGVDLDAARERVAEARGAEDRLRERVASVRGELNARRELDAETADAETALREAASALSEAETERIAAEQALDEARRRAREARDVRERRLELADAVANLVREARRELADAVRDPVREAVADVPGSPNTSGESEHGCGGSPSLRAVDPTTAALAAVRVASLDAPVVLALHERRFADARSAASVLDVPVVRV